jgi:hypothetical protein
MKKYILLAFVSLLISCSNDNDSSSNPTKVKNVEYEFTITINGQVNKIKGNTADGIPMGQAGPYFNGYSYINNSCNWTTSNPFVVLKINDVSASNYVSGQNMYCSIMLQNTLLGTCQGMVTLSGGAFDSVATSLGAPRWNWSITNGATGFSINYLPINITDLGTIPTTNTGAISSFGSTFKGKYSGTVYLMNATNGHFTIPVQLSIDFKAVRLG